MALELTRFDSVDAFEARALPFLLEREAEHNLFIGLLGQMRDGRYTEPYLASVEDGGHIVGAAWRTPPHIVGLSQMTDPHAVELIANDLRQVYDSISGVVGGPDDAHRFAVAWSSLSGANARLAEKQRIHVADHAVRPSGVAGEARLATVADRDRLIAWHSAFNDEAEVVHVGDVAANVDYRLDGDPTRGALLWFVAGEPVAMAGFANPTPNGCRLGPVYTPPELREQGYGTAVTAALTQRLLDTGRRFVFLYTDLANPVSNSIYAKIGYVPVSDVDRYLFD
jgi:predicted GNAT family acetyltransferase